MGSKIYFYQEEEEEDEEEDEGEGGGEGRTLCRRATGREGRGAGDGQHQVFRNTQLSQCYITLLKLW